MSENDIKPVAWVDLECWKATNCAGESFFTDYQDEETVALYDQSAIDRLSTQLKHYRMAAEAEANLADERGKRIDRLTEERDDLNALLAALQARHREVMAERDAAVAELARVKASVGAIYYAVRTGFSAKAILAECVEAAPELATIDNASSEGE